MFYICYEDENGGVRDWGKAPRETEAEAEADLAYWKRIDPVQYADVVSIL